MTKINYISHMSDLDDKFSYPIKYIRFNHNTIYSFHILNSKNYLAKQIAKKASKYYNVAVFEEYLFHKAQKS